MVASFFINTIQISCTVLPLSLLEALESNVTANFTFTNRLKIVHYISKSEQERGIMPKWQELADTTALKTTS